jgi:hypothetical protein
VYGPRKKRSRLIDPFVPRERVTAYRGLTGQRLWRELRERGYAGGAAPSDCRAAGTNIPDHSRSEPFRLPAANSDDLARVYRFDLAQDSEMISPTIPI